MKLVSLNIQEDFNLNRIPLFLTNEAPDIFCAQEIFLETFNAWQKDFGWYGVFDHEVFCQGNDGLTHSRGNAIFSRTPLLEKYLIPYTDMCAEVDLGSSFAGYKPEEDLNKNTINVRSRRKLLAVDVLIHGVKYRIANTKFTWAYYGSFDRKTGDFVWGVEPSTLAQQEIDMEKLLKVFDILGEVIFCADLNAPRGKEVFDTLASKLKDNIPLAYTSSIDGTLHRAGALPLMVDGLFTSKEYIAKNVRLVGGVSDHMAVVAEVEKIA